MQERQKNLISILYFIVDVNSWPESTRNLFRFVKINPLFIIRNVFATKRLFFFCLANNERQMASRFATMFEESSCGSHLPSFSIFPIAFKWWDIVDSLTPSCPASSCNVCSEFSLSNAFNCLLFSISFGRSESELS